MRFRIAYDGGKYWVEARRNLRRWCPLPVNLFDWQLTVLYSNDEIKNKTAFFKTQEEAHNHIQRFKEEYKSFKIGKNAVYVEVEE